MTNEQIINSIYQSLFGRDGEPAGLNFYLGEIANGNLSIATLAIAILDGARGDDAIIAAAKIDAADLFTTHLDLATEQNAYGPGNESGLTYAISVGQEFLRGVTTPGSATIEVTDAAILRLFVSEGQIIGGGGQSNAGGGSEPANSVTLFDSAGTILASSPTLNPFPDGNEASFNPVWDAAQPGDTVRVTGLDHVIENLPYELQWFLNQEVPLPDFDPAEVTQFIDAAFGAQGFIDIGGFKLPPPENLLFNTPSWFDHDSPLLPTTMSGTGSNDIMVYLDTGAGVHIASGGGGQDIIISVSSDLLSHLPDILNGDQSYLSSLYDFTLGQHILAGGQGDDVIVSAGGAGNELSGGDGNDVIVSLLVGQDTIDGGSGDDIIFAGPDSYAGTTTPQMVTAAVAIDYDPFLYGDVLKGGTGDDMFVYSAQGSLSGAQASLSDDLGIEGLESLPLAPLVGNGFDTITDFKDGNDTIVLLMDAPEGYAQSGISAAALDELPAYIVDYTEAEAVSLLDAQDAANAEFASMSGVDLGIFVAKVGNDSYVFVDDDASGSFDFAIKLQDFNDLSKIDLVDFQFLNFEDGLSEIGTLGSTPAQSFLLAA